jgi:tetratricopeptide (TPR) repeat protein
MYLESIEINGRVRGVEHRHTLVMQTALAKFYRDNGRPEEFERMYRELAPVMRRVLGATRETAMVEYHLAQFLAENDRHADAVEFFKASHENWQSMTSENHLYSIRVLGAVAHAEMKAGQLEAACSSYDRMLELIDSNPEISADYTARQAVLAADCHQAAGRLDESAAYLVRSFRIRWNENESTSESTNTIADSIAELYDIMHAQSQLPEHNDLAECWRAGPCRELPSGMGEQRDNPPEPKPGEDGH